MHTCMCVYDCWCHINTNCESKRVADGGWGATSDVVALVKDCVCVCALLVGFGC